MSESYNTKDSQLSWLDKTLADAVTDDTIQWTFVFGHYPI